MWTVRIIKKNILSLQFLRANGESGTGGDGHEGKSVARDVPSPPPVPSPSTPSVHYGHSLRSFPSYQPRERSEGWPRVTRDGRDQKWWRRKSRPSYRSLSSTTLRFAHCNDYRGKRLVSWAKPFLYEWSEGSRERLSPVIIRREPSRPQARRPRMTQNKIQYYMKWGTGGD